jgi:Flp pilus assembly protein TadG
MKLTPWRSPFRQGLGQSAVEFALVLPLLFLIIFGLFDLARLYHAAITISGAARAGARYGAMFPDEGADIIAAVEAEAAGSGIDLTDTALSEIVVSCPVDDNCVTGLPIRVEITYTMELILPSFLANPDVPIYSYAEFMVP